MDNWKVKKAFLLKKGINFTKDPSNVRKTNHTEICNYADEDTNF